MQCVAMACVFLSVLLPKLIVYQVKFVREVNVPEFAAAMTNVGKVEFALTECAHLDACHQVNANPMKSVATINARVRAFSYLQVYIHLIALFLTEFVVF